MATSTQQKQPTPPVSEAQLHLIAKDACETTLQAATAYSHPQTETWNASIINKILTSLTTSAPATASTSAPAPAQKPQYKYAVNSTIIQHLSDSHTSSAPGTENVGTSTHADGTQEASPPTTPTAPSASRGVAPDRGRRGMHSATGAYWNNETDGMWSYKWEGGETKGMDVVISVIWVAV